MTCVESIYAVRTHTNEGLNSYVDQKTSFQLIILKVFSIIIESLKRHSNDWKNRPAKKVMWKKFELWHFENLQIFHSKYFIWVYIYSIQSRLQLYSISTNCRQKAYQTGLSKWCLDAFLLSINILSTIST